METKLLVVSTLSYIRNSKYNVHMKPVLPQKKRKEKKYDNKMQSVTLNWILHEKTFFLLFAQRILGTVTHEENET